VLAVLREETGPAGDRTFCSLEDRGDSFNSYCSVVYRSISDLISTNILEPHPVSSPKTTVAYLGYSSGTSGKAKGVRTSHYNMTVRPHDVFPSPRVGTDSVFYEQSVLSILGPLDVTPKDIHLAVLPLNHIYGLTCVFPHPLLPPIRRD
jgi:acyl-CoA synthetase (AMP-forming)/AMP-acid ligase II